MPHLGVFTAGRPTVKTPSSTVGAITAGTRTGSRRPWPP